VELSVALVPPPLRVQRLGRMGRGSGDGGFADLYAGTVAVYVWPLGAFAARPCAMRLHAALRGHYLPDGHLALYAGDAFERRRPPTRLLPRPERPTTGSRVAGLPTCDRAGYFTKQSCIDYTYVLLLAKNATRRAR
jgi:hypothetical protein